MPAEPAMPAAVFARVFGGEAERYQRMRPPYPKQAVDFVLAGRPAGRVLDVGAGTGKLTRLLVPTGAAVVAVEPVACMRDELRRRVPGIEVVDGTAESNPLPDSSADAVTAAQAFHWFDGSKALPEIHRVLRPGGVVGLIWNLPDHRVDWIPELFEAVREPEPPWSAAYQDLDTGLFTPAEAHWTSWRYRLPGLPGLRELVHTWSWVITRPATEQRAIDERLRVLASRHAELQGETIGFPFRTKAVRQHLR